MDLRQERKVGLGRGQSLLQTQVAGKEGVSPFCTSRPDLTQTFIQQIFIKRLFVQGTSGECSAPRPQPPSRPPAVSGMLEKGCPGPRSHPGDGPTPAQVPSWPRPSPALALPAGTGRYAQRAQPHLVGFSTSSAKEVPSLHSKVNFLRFSRRPWQQPWPGHKPRHSTHDSGRVVWQMA